MEELKFYLKRGLWKLVEELVQTRLSPSEPVASNELTAINEFLWNLAIHHDDNRSSLPSSWEESWLAASVLCRQQKIEMDNYTFTEVTALKSETAFKDTLNELLVAHFDSSIFEELTLLFSQVIRADKTKSPAQQLTSKAHSFLCNSLLDNPVLSNTLVQKLLCLWCLLFKGTDDEIQGIYKEALWQCVQQLEDTHNSDSTSTADTRSLSSALLSLISSLQISEEKSLSLLEWLCPRVVYLHELGILSRRYTYMAFGSREKPKWLQTLVNVEDERYDRNGELVEDAATVERMCLRLMDAEDNLHAEEAFRRSMKTGNHFIEDIVGICSKLIVKGGKDTVRDCISGSILKDLWPIIMLYMWNHYADNEDIFSILSWLIEECKKTESDPTFVRLCVLLEHQIQIVEWVRKNSAGKPATNNDLLQLTYKHSTLEMMRRTTNLSEANWTEVNKILHHGPDVLGGVTADQSDSSTSSAQWDMIIFHGFCILTTAFKAIAAAMELQSLYKKINKCHECTTKDVKSIIPAYFARNYPSVLLQHPCLETGSDNLDWHSIESMYAETVTKRLESIKQLISKLFPLNFRVEILENIFSLLFLRYEDLKEENLSDSAGEDDDPERGVKSPDIEESTFETCERSSSSVHSPGFRFHSNVSVSPLLKTIPLIDSQVSASPPSSKNLTTPPITVPNTAGPSETIETNDNWSWPQTKLAESSLTNTISSLPADIFSTTETSKSPTIGVTPPTPNIDSSPNVMLHSSSSRLQQSSSYHSDPLWEFKRSSSSPLSYSRMRELHRKYSSATSTRSAPGSVLTDTGFICNEFVVRDIISCLKDCLIDTSAAYYSSLSQVKEEQLIQVLSSITPDTVQQRMNRLSQCVSEAAWRLQLLTDNDFTKNVGKLSAPELTRVFTPTHSEWMYCVEESESESEEECEAVEVREQTTLKTNARKTLKKTITESDKSSESGSQSNTTGGGSASGSSHHRVRHHSKLKPKHASLLRVSKAVINLMLSSPSSLVVQCLARGHLLKAQQVIQICGMEDNSLSVEVKFTEAYQSLRKKLESKSCGSEMDKNNTSLAQEQKTGKTTLQAIKIAAMTGVQSTMFSSNVESFLSITTLPSIHGAATASKDFPQSVKVLQDANNGVAMTAIDLALTVGTRYEHSVSLLDVASKYCSSLHATTTPNASPLLDKRSKQPVGFINFTRLMIHLMNEINRNSTEDQKSSVFPQNVSLNNILMNDQFPLHSKVFTDCVSFWDSLQSTVSEFEVTLLDETNKCKDLKTKGISTPTKEIHNKIAHINFRKLIKASCSGSTSKDLNKVLLAKEPSGNSPQYLQQFYTYLKLLTSLLIQNLPSSKGLLCPGTYFDVLDESLIALIGRLVFECDVPPTRLEPIAYRMRLDLVYNIVRNCCPRIPVKTCFSTSTYYERTATWGKVVLNQRQEEWAGPVRHPEVAVRSLLSDLLETINQESNNHGLCNMIRSKEASLLAANPSVRSVLADSRELAYLDLRLLNVGNETLVFYTNLMNLMWIHCLLFVEAPFDLMKATEENQVDLASFENLRGQFDLLSENPLQRYLAQKSIGYNVGQLEFVSLHNLQKQILGENIFPKMDPMSNLFVSTLHVNDKILWSCLTESADPRVMFAVTNGCVYSPKVQVLYIENVDEQLDRSMMEFFNASVRVEGNCLVIPECVGWYSTYNQVDAEPDDDAVEKAEDSLVVGVLLDDEKPVEKSSSLVKFLLDNSSGQLQTCLVNLANSAKEVDVDVKKPCMEYGITLEYTNVQGGFNDKVHHSHSSKSAKTTDSWKERIVGDVVVKFLERHCWLLSVLVIKIHHNEELHGSLTILNQTDNRTRCVEQLLTYDSITVLKAIYEDNAVESALRLYPDATRLWNHLATLTREQEWSSCFEILCALPEKQVRSDPKLQTFNDLVMNELASITPSTDFPMPWQYCQYIGDVSLQSDCVCRNLHHWPGAGCEQALRVLLDDRRGLITNEMRGKLERKLHKIQIYNKILLCCSSRLNMTAWYNVHSLSKDNPSMILKHLIDAKEPLLCLEWAELHHIATRAQQLVDSQLLFLLLNSEPPNYKAAMKLLQSLFTIQAVSICEDLTHQLRSISSLTFIVNFLLGSCSAVLSPDDLIRYRHLSIGVQMLSILPSSQQPPFLDLIDQPRLIVEQFVMNTRLDMLERMLDVVRPTLVQLPVGSPVSVSSIDLLLRQYAAKALDFRVIQVQSALATATANEEKLLVSLSTLSVGSGEFVMPANVPTKDQWMPNDQVTECMCCDAVAFSMFNRRHHCRRCGRVVCWSCSRQRLKVSGYGDVLVRVCDDCYSEMQQTTLGSDQSSVISSRENHSGSHLGSLNSFARDLPWRLTSDDTHNTTVREEFGFEHAPSVSLCLAILKLHSEQTAYPRFLLDSCDNMLQLLQPVRPGTLNREVDHGLVIRMVRALIVAAKVKYARSGLNTGVAHCDQLLSQADLLSELVRSDCSSLIPGEALNGHALRRLRDRLVEEELWSLAMDVSTKGGLERTGVWAAWGKASLRSGRWDEARQKFSHCLEKVSSNLDGPRPVRNPPLLQEIVHILETGAYVVDRKVIQQADKIRASHDSKLTVMASPALSILHTLSSLKNVSQGKYPQASSPSNIVIIGPKLDPLFYEECQYYLKTYGSHAGILTFYLGHDDMAATLKHVLAQKVEPSVFYEHVYMPCLRRGLLANLNHGIEAIDSTLAVWKIYLCHTCRHLERLGYLNVLYQLQLYMKDYVRAAMTCIRFYRSGARNYSNLASNLDYLQKAHKHLEAELASQWGTTGRSQSGSGRRSSTSSSGSLLPMNLEPREVDRHINTILRQIEVTKFLHTCEIEQRPVIQLVPEVFKNLTVVGGDSNGAETRVPTLFGNNTEKVQLAVLIVICGKNVEEGFGTAFRIIQDYHLKACQVFSLAGKKLASDNRLKDVEQLMRCIQSSGVADTNTMCDEVLTLCVRVRAEQTDPGNVEPLIKLIVDTGNKISAYIECRQLKSAYLLAVKYDRVGDVRRIYREAERLGQTSIRKICAKRLSQQTSSSTQPLL